MSIAQTMQAWRIHKYGGPDVMQFEDVPVPQPGKGELLVRVVAASVNPIDWKIREGMLRGNFEVRFPRVPGRDCSGLVAGVGPGADDFKEGDEVAAVAGPMSDGTHAEYAVVSAAAAARKPAGIDFPSAASLGISGLSAYIPLAEDAAPLAGKCVMVHAGAGGVGSLAVQIARHLGADVAATCGTANVPYVSSLGARRVIDYTREDLADLAGQFDVVLDTLGGDAHRRSYALLKTGGRMVCLSAAPIPDRPMRNDVSVIRSQIRPTRERLERILEWAAKGVIKPQVEKIFPLAQAPAAYALSQGGHARGKIVLAAS